MCGNSEVEKAQFCALIYFGTKMVALHPQFRCGCGKSSAEIAHSVRTPRVNFTLSATSTLQPSAQDAERGANNAKNHYADVVATFTSAFSAALMACSVVSLS
jgi:hypothetical protein